MPTPTDLFAAIISGVHPVADGYLVTDGPRGRSFQLDALGAIRTTYINPVNQNGPMTQGATPQGNTVFRYEYYPADFDGFDGLVLAPGDPIEINPIITPLCLTSGTEEADGTDAVLFPNPANDQVTVQLDQQGAVMVSVFDATGRLRASAPLSITGQVTIDLSDLLPAMYAVVVMDGAGRSLAVSRLVKVD
jgi:hypothetical protein